ncbi:hypothetical protein LLEC1_01569 [Akanthomyces lecanii]|uniref:Uncharacterized protein n=1 Tax=Cordyceps confragosa TaxID=2714763 RepID=A0A179I341_CORDF|nr:hypothetical protein LLEC1_01569 [Akanthomyces lecanii]
MLQYDVRGKLSWTDCAAIRGVVESSCVRIRRRAEFSLARDHLSSYPALSKSSKKSFPMPSSCTSSCFVCIYCREQSIEVEKNLRDLGHCKRLCVALIRYRGILPVSGIAVVIESVQAIRGENFLWGEKPYGKRGTAHVTISHLIEPSVGRGRPPCC